MGQTITMAPKSDTPRARPFLKWAGGKTQLLPVFQSCYPGELRTGAIRRYVEPFLGGGAVFFDVMQAFPIEEARLFDINEELVLCYRVVQQDPHGLIALLEEQRRRYLECAPPARAEHFYALRARFNAHRALMDYRQFSPAWVERAAELIFLNKTCFNGLYRVNAAGQFNVPFGAYKNPELFNRDSLLLASALLQRAELHHGPWQAARPHIDDGTFVYFDPPYRPLSASSSFTSYARTGFADADQLRLAACFAQLHRETAAKLMLSNSDPTSVAPDDRFFDDAYAGFHIRRVEASRMINSVGHGRGKISELVITNYPLQMQSHPADQPEAALLAH